MQKSSLRFGNDQYCQNAADHKFSICYKFNTSNDVNNQIFDPANMEHAKLVKKKPKNDWMLRWVRDYRWVVDSFSIVASSCCSLGPENYLFFVMWSTLAVSDVQLFTVLLCLRHKCFWESFCADPVIHTESRKVEESTMAMHILLIHILERKWICSRQDWSKKYWIN